MQVKLRNSSIELLRVLLMWFIVMHHGIVHGLGLDSFAPWHGTLYVDNSEVPLVGTINLFLIFSINCFLLISGYFSVKKSYIKILTLFFKAVFFAFLFTTLPLVASGRASEAVWSLFVLSNGRYWFIPYYFVLVLISPILNAFFEKKDFIEIKGLVGLLLIASCYLGFIWNNKINDNGYTFFQFVLMYSIGRYIRLKGITWKPVFSLIVYLIPVIINAVLFLLAYYSEKNDILWKLTYYNNPLVIISSVGFFMFFAGISIKSKIINWVSSSSFSIYLISCTVLVSDLYYRFVQQCYNSKGLWGGVLSVLVMSLLICLTSVLIDKVHLCLFNKWYKIIEKKFN